MKSHFDSSLDSIKTDPSFIEDNENEIIKASSIRGKKIKGSLTFEDPNKLKSLTQPLTQFNLKEEKKTVNSNNFN